MEPSEGLSVLQQLNDHTLYPVLSKETVFAGVAALAGILGLTITSAKSGASTSETTPSTKKTSSVETVDVSIPYNAAAMLEYSKWKSGSSSEATFQKFLPIYERKTVAQVTVKKVARDFELESERLQAIIANADAELASLA